jgi:putative heme-binding domain-containing protein
MSAPFRRDEDLRMKWTASLLTFALLSLGGARVVAQNPPAKNPFEGNADAIRAGMGIFRSRCADCHGVDARGIRSPDLTQIWASGRTDEGLFKTLRNGIPNTEMPGVNVPDLEIWRMVGHVQQLSRRGTAEPSRGDANAGAAVYQKNGCATCHTIGGSGGFFGPDLTAIGAKRAVRHLRESIVDPNADIPLDYRSVAVTLRSGANISGIHLNEDEYSVHLRDPSGNLRSFMKRDLAQIALPRTSMMPPYTTLSSTDLENLVAYLSALGSEKASQLATAAPAMEIWTFDRLDNIGGYPTTVQGEPRIIDSPVGKAVEFDGRDDALFIDNHPLAGAAAFTFEAIFRPDGGEKEQRWFHLNELPATGADRENRMLFEIRVVDDKWYFDSYNQSGSANKALINRTALHPLGVWYHVAAVYDGKVFSNYVDGVREGAAELHLAPHGPGRTSVGARINKLFYFKGAVHLARFTRRALTTSEFLKVPAKPED